MDQASAAVDVQEETKMENIEITTRSYRPLKRTNSGITISYLLENRGETSLVARGSYKELPDSETLKTDIEAAINTYVDNKILTGFSWDTHQVWLSAENQRNYSSLSEMSREDENFTVPVRIRDAQGSYIFLETAEEVQGFCLEMQKFIREAVQHGWDLKDSYDYSVYQTV